MASWLSQLLALFCLNPIFDSILIESILATTSIESVLNVVLLLDDIVVSMVDALLSATGVDVSVALYGVLQAANEISMVAAFKILSFI